MTLSPLLKLSLRGMLAWCLFSAAGFIFVRPITGALSPLIEGIVNSMQSDFTAYVSVVDGHEGPLISMSCTANHVLVLPHGKIIPFLAEFTCASSHAVHALVPIIIFLVAVTTWPVKHRHEAIRRILAAVVLLPIVVALTTPVLLIGLVDTRLYPQSFSADAQLTALLQPFVFMEMGGEWLLPLLAAVVCVRIAAQHISRPLSVAGCSP